MDARMSRYIFAAMLLLCALFARASTTLTGTITDSQGNPLNGTLTMRLPLPAQDSCLNTAVSPATVTFTLVNGAITGGAPLKDVATCLQPAGLYYIARAYDTAGALQFYGNYVVTGASFNLGAATPTSVTTSNVSYVLPIFPNQTNTFTAAQIFTTINSTSAPNAATGFIRMGATDQNCWRNTGNTADLCVGNAQNISSVDYLSFNGLLVSPNLISATGNNTLTLQTVGAVLNGSNITINPADGIGGGNGGTVILRPGAKGLGGANGVVNIVHGVTGSGLQHKRTASCTTGAGAGSTCNTTVSWNVSFDDTSYTASCNVSGGTGAVTGTPYVLNTSSKTISQIVVTIVNLTAVASSGTIDCIAAHD